MKRWPHSQLEAELVRLDVFCAPSPFSSRKLLHSPLSSTSSFFSVSRLSNVGKREREREDKTLQHSRNGVGFFKEKKEKKSFLNNLYLKVFLVRANSALKTDKETKIDMR